MIMKKDEIKGIRMVKKIEIWGGKYKIREMVTRIEIKREMRALKVGIGRNQEVRLY